MFKPPGHDYMLCYNCREIKLCSTVVRDEGLCDQCRMELWINRKL